MNITPAYSYSTIFNCLIICLVLCERSGRPNVRKKVKENDHTFCKISVLREGCKGYIYISITESVAYQVIFASCLSQNPNEQGMSARGFLTQTTSERTLFKAHSMM